MFVARDAPARAALIARVATDAMLPSGSLESRIVSWAAGLASIEVTSANTGASARIRLYDPTGGIDDDARTAFERVASREAEPHRLALRVEQLVFKAAYHFGVGGVRVVSGWRERAGKHTAAEAIDFRLDGVAPAKVAAYLRELPRVGVGIYTHPATQYVHIDIREPSYSWIDASPPGARWKERQLGDAHAAKRDAAYDPAMDLPI
ncbi:MAG: DUF882 domain-containing protein [Myxococcota bacterium]|nr:DUF882 domain-containing protein [Myxococcota bacterium]